VAGRIQNWLHDPDFRGLRGADALSKLPDGERQAWRQFWDDVQRLLDQTQATAASQPKP